MGMTIRTNTGGNTSCRNLKRSSKKGDSNLQKLSSGYQINKSADDASGLGITEKMRAQINALETIAPGCQDGINLLNTADGYLDEMQNMLVRMTELSEKAANGVLDDPTDRAALQEEMNHLGAEIDRIADTANFNGNKLFVPKIVTVYDKVMVNEPEEVEYSQYFSSPAPNYMELDPSLVTAAKDDEQRMRGDTLTKLAAEVKNYMEGKSPALTTMDKGKIYYNKAGKVLIDAPMPLSKSEDDIKAELGEEYFSVDTFPDPEKRYTTFTLPACREHISINFNQNKSIGGTSNSAKQATYTFLETFTRDYLQNDPNMKGKSVDQKLDYLKDKSIYYKKDSYEAVIAKESPKPESDWYSEAIEYTPERKEPVKVTKEISPIHHYKQSYVVGEKEKEVPREVEMPITLQIGETAQKADKLNIALYDLHTDKLFNEEIREVIGYEKSFFPATQDRLVFEPIEGNTDEVNGDWHFVPGRPAGWYDDPSKPIEEVKNARRDNTETSAYENAITFDVSTQQNAISNITHARDVTDKISMIRASYGAMSNRLEKTISNHENTIENMSAAKSRIKDTDMAKEIMEYTQNNVLTQSAQSMLAQANTQPQNVLQLLQ